MKRLLLMTTTALGALALFAGTAAAANPGTGGVSIETGNSYDVFQPIPVPPGGTTHITVTTFQSGSEGSHATVTFSDLPAGVTFDHNGDTSAVCNQVGATLTCSYTDYAHSAKSDSYYFDVVAGPTTKDQCKNGGWMDYGVLFKNQGDCVSYVATGGTNSPAGFGTYTVGIAVHVNGVGDADVTVPLTIG